MFMDPKIGGVIAVFVLFLLISRGVERLLRWMDDKDWILIPNREAMNNAESRMMRMFMEIQAYVEPAKRNVIRQKEERSLKKVEDPSGDDPSNLAAID